MAEEEVGMPEFERRLEKIVLEVRPHRTEPRRLEVRELRRGRRASAAKLVSGSKPPM